MQEASNSKTKQKLLNFSRYSPRRNLPSCLSGKRGESNFARSFERAYLEQVGRAGTGGSEFGLADFGIADFIWISWHPDDSTTSSAITLEHRLKKRKLCAFELKLMDWRKGLSQAFRYGYFSDLTVLVLPHNSARVARANIDRFREMHVGLWIFDAKQKKIRKVYTPRCKARNPLAKERAIQTILAKIKFSKFCK